MAKNRLDVIRTFIAVELADTLRASLAEIQQDLKELLSPCLPHGVRLSWVHPASIHLTLKFLGETDEQLIQPLRSALEPFMGSVLPISIPLERLGVFPSSQQPRVLWIGPPSRWEQGQDAERLMRLQRIVEDACEPLGFTREVRPFRAHLTLARIKQGERQVGRALEQKGILDRPLNLSFVIASMVCMKSEMRSSGSVYSTLCGIG
jgi:RNA 2',3'-cyclic 3'-phosphodiesterase